LDGSARIALKIKPCFNKYIFIEKDNGRCEQLSALIKETEFKNLSNNIEIRNGDANEEIQKICQLNWKDKRAVLFLDPYGMQVQWNTIKAIASTKAIDLWYLFPLGQAINRLLKKDGNISDPNRKKLDSVLGEGWYNEIYKNNKINTLFGEENEITKAGMDQIGCLFKKRLENIFAGVCENPRELRNSKNNTLYLLFFAVSNEGRGKDIALKIANHILKD
jgi:three-Cys-motif partner protein